MHHSIAARFTARPAARFPRPSTRDRERRLGLRTRSAFRAAPALPTLLRGAELGPLVQLHADWRTITPARPSGGPSMRLRSASPMAWTSSTSSRPHRLRAVAAPWRD
jgi:hypothetical protein